MHCASLITFIIVLWKFCSTDACNGGNANAFIDEVLANAKPDLAQKIRLPDVNSDETNLWDIYVWGFDSLKRGGDVCFENNGEARQTVRANFQVFNVRGSARGSHKRVLKIFGRKIAQKTFKFGVDAVIPHVKVRLALDIDHNARRITLNEFEFEAFDNAKFRVKLNGIWKLFNFVVNMLADRFGNKHLKPKAKDVMRNSFAKAVTNFNKFDLIPH